MKAPGTRSSHGPHGVAALILMALALLLGCGKEGARPTSPDQPSHVAPSAPGNLQITEVTGTSARLTWQDFSSNEDGFYVYQDTLGDGSTSFVLTVGSNVTTCVDATLAPGRNYYYRVCAYNSAGTSQGYAAGQLTTPGGSPPWLTLDHASLDFSAVAGSANPAAQLVQVTNGGSGALTGLGASVTYTGGEPLGWLGASLGGTTAPATLTVQPLTGGLAAGTYHATISVLSPAAGNNPQFVNVTFTVAAVAVPLIGLSATSLTFHVIANSGNPPAQSIDVTNVGGGTLDQLSMSTTSTGSGWLTLSLGLSAPTQFRAQPQVGSRAPGTYTATTSISSPVAGNSPQAVEITLIVEPEPVPPEIGLSMWTHRFNATSGGANPAPEPGNIWNTGGGTLSGLVAEVSYASGQPTGWLSVSLGGTVAPTTFTLTATTGMLAAGTFDATVTFTAPGASNTPRTIAVTFTVAPAAVPPQIGLSGTTLAFNATAGGASPAAEAINVTNTGGGTLSGLGASVTYAGGEPTGWLSASLSATSAPAALTATAATGALVAGTYHATITLAAPGASNTPRTIAVTFTVAPAAVPPQIGLSVTTLAFNATAGGASPAAEAINVTNTGGGTLSGLGASVTYAGGQPLGWLSASLDVTSAPATLTARSTTGALGAGVYNATITVSAPGASNSPRTIAVTFTVAPGATPLIGLSSTSLTFSAIAGGTPAPDQVVNITNRGGGTLANLATSIVGGGTLMWLNRSLAGTTAPTTLTVTALLNGPFSPLPAGTYTTTIQVSAPGASNSPQLVSVTYTILPPTSILAYASEDNLLWINSEVAAYANTVYRSAVNAVGFEYFYNGLGSFTYLGYAFALKFNVQSQISGRSIKRAVLRLYPYGLRGDFTQDPQLRLDTNAADWSPTGITWNNGFALVARSGVSITKFMPNSSAALEFDVTASVQNWASGTWGNFGFKVVPVNYFAPGYESYQATQFQSLENWWYLSQRPQLEIDFN